jgi:hypothetical protein
VTPLDIEERARDAWSRTVLRVWPEAYILASLPVSLAKEAAQLLADGVAGGAFGALVIERDEASVTIPEEAWLGSPLRSRARSEGGPYRAITFDVDLALDLVGFLAPAAVLLAEARVSIVPQCACLKDHLLVREGDLATATRVLEELIGGCRK